MATQRTFPPGDQVDLFGHLPSSFCRVCGRTLTNPTSVAAGIGPICSGGGGGGGRFGGARNPDYDPAGRSDVYDPTRPLGDGVRIWRQGGRVHTNVPWLHVHHSPGGYEFGYGGSGPADLALNLSALVVRELQAGGLSVVRWIDLWDGTQVPAQVWAVHQDVKRRLVASLEHDGPHVLAWPDVAAVVAEELATWERREQAAERGEPWPDADQDEFTRPGAP